MASTQKFADSWGIIVLINDFSVEIIINDPSSGNSLPAENDKV